MRFITINDCYDSNNYVGDTGGFEISIKNLISQIYSQDAFKKTQTSFQSKARSGGYIAFFCKARIQKEEGRHDRLNLKREKLFHKLMDNQINDDEYMNLSGEIEREQISLEDTIRELKRNIKLITAKKKEKESAVTTYKELGKIKKIDRDVVDRFI